jgi:hypothetical protein
LEIVAAICLLIGVVAFSRINFQGINYILGAIAGFGAVLLFIWSVVLLVSALGLIFRKKWGWWLGVIIAVILIVSVLFLDVIGFVLGIIMIYYLTRKNVKVWFKV